MTNMKYIVTVNESSVGYIEVEANNPQQAIDLAEEIYLAGNTNWEDTEVSFVVL